MREEKLFKLEQVIFDVDGVFTNGQFLYNKDGKQYKIFGAHDADGIRMLLEKEIAVSAISADKRGFPITKKRMDDIGITVTLVSENDRIEYFKNCGDLSKTCFMGDGHYDAKIFNIVTYSIAPSNAVDVAKKSASFVTNLPGGNGAVYEACVHLLGKMEN